MGQLFYFNYFAIGSLIPFVMSFLVALYLFSIKTRSTAGTYLGLAFLGHSTITLLYFVGASLYHPLGAYHRVFAILGTLMGQLYLFQFFRRYPVHTKPRLATALLIIQWALIIPTVLYFL